MNYQKSTLNAYTTTLQAVATDTPVSFTGAKRTGCSILFSPGSTSVTLIKPGLYYVNMSATGVVTTSSGNITLQLYNNNTAVLGASASSTSASTSSEVNLSFSTIVEVKPSCPSIDNTQVLTIVNTGQGATYSNLNLNIFKLA